MRPARRERLSDNDKADLDPTASGHPTRVFVLAKRSKREPDSQRERHSSHIGTFSESRTKEEADPYFRSLIFPKHTQK